MVFVFHYVMVILVSLLCINADTSSLTSNLSPMDVTLYNNIYAYTLILNISSFNTNNTNNFTDIIVAVIDTGSSAFTLVSVDEAVNGTCSVENPNLEKDMSTVLYNSNINVGTAYSINLINSTNVSIATINQSTFIDSCSFYAQESQLHEWTYGVNTTVMSTGISTPSSDITMASNSLLGLSYCTTSTSVTTVDGVTVTTLNMTGGTG